MNSVPLPDPSEVALDREQVFLLYATFAGDVVRTAHAAGVRAVDVLRVADEENWTEKLKPIIELQKSQRPGDMERAVNRAVNYVQAHKLRLFIEKVVGRICGMNEEELKEYLFPQETQYNKDGSVRCEVKKLATRALADLASALEKVHSMTYLALNDVAADRSRRKESAADDAADIGALHVRMAAAMAEVKTSPSIRAQLFDAQLTASASVMKEAIQTAPPVNPLDNDDH